jgi:hypothetical protein
MIAVLLVLLFIVVPARAESAFQFKNSDEFNCGTSPVRTDQTLALTRSIRQRSARLLSTTAEALTVDRGNLAVLEDDGTVITQPNPLDLTNWAITFTPSGSDRYSVISLAASVDRRSDAATTLTLADDDSAQVSLPFPFPFFGRSYTSVFVNSDGNLTLTASDTASTARNLSRVTGGVPRIFPLFTDLNPTDPGRVSIEELSDGVLFTWTAVGEWTTGGGSRGQNTFQVGLYSNGVIRFDYTRLDATSAVVGIAPGRAADAANSLIDLNAQSTPATLPGVIAEVFAVTQEIDLAQAARIFYRTHPDAYDALVVFSDFSLDFDGAFAFANPIRNSIRGITSGARSGIYDYGADFGSRERLSVVINMGDIARYPVDPRQRFMRTYNGLSILAHEFGHRWLSYIDTPTPSLLDSDRAHWGFLHNALGSVMEGNQFEDLGNGRFRTVAASFRYSPLDQYIMGLRAATEVPPWFVVTTPTILTPIPSDFPLECRSLTGLPGCRPHVGVQLSGTRRDVTIDEIVANAGPRTPSVEEAQKDFRVAFILVTRRGNAPRPVSVQILEPLIAQWPAFFNEIAEGRGTVNADLLYLPPGHVEVLAEIPANGSRRVETTGIDSSTRVGYSTLESALGISIVRFTAGADIRSEAAIPAATIGHTFRVYAERSPVSSTGLALLNTSATTAATITAQLSNGSGTILQLPPRSQRSLFVHELFTGLSMDFSGVLQLTSNVPIGLVALRGTLNQRNEFIITTVPLSAGSTTGDIRAFPQIADGSGYATELILLNPTTTTISGALEFSFAAATDRGTATRFSYEIPAGAAWKLRTAGLRPEVQVGFATLIPAAGQEVPVATAILKQSFGTNLNFEAGVPAAQAFTRGVMFGVNDPAHRSVLALVNRGATAATIRLTAYRTNGSIPVPARTISLASNQHLAGFLDEVIPDLPGDFEGKVILESTAPIFMITMRTLVNQSGAFLMTAMPLIDLDQSPLSAVSYFPQLVDGGNFSTEYLLINSDPATAHLQFFGLDGQPLAVPLR